jgi:hypothetical protein
MTWSSSGKVQDAMDSLTDTGAVGQWSLMSVRELLQMVPDEKGNRFSRVDSGKVESVR